MVSICIARTHTANEAKHIKRKVEKYVKEKDVIVEDLSAGGDKGFHVCVTEMSD